MQQLLPNLQNVMGGLMEAEMTQDQYLKFITTIIRGVYALKPAKIEVAAGDTMVVHLKCTFNLPAPKEDAIKYLILKNFDGINFHPLVIIE